MRNRYIFFSYMENTSNSFSVYQFFSINKILSTMQIKIKSQIICLLEATLEVFHTFI